MATSQQSDLDKALFMKQLQAAMKGSGNYPYTLSWQEQVLYLLALTAAK